MSAIQFDHAPKKQIPSLTGSTSFSYAFVIGAMHLCRNHEHGCQTGKNEASIKYPTNLKGLKDVSGQAEELVSTLHIAKETIGILMAYVSKEDISSIGWLIAGLSELAQMTDFAACEMNYALYNEAKRNNNRNLIQTNSIVHWLSTS